jgi:replicative DNA helicase
MKKLVVEAIEEIEAMHARQGAISGVPTGFIDLDRMTDGMHGGEMIVIAGRPSTGKTSLAMNIVEHVALDLTLPVGVFSLEMSARSLATRMLASRARVNLRSVRDGFMAERDFPKLTGAAGKLAGASIHIDQTGGIPLLQLKAKARLWRQRYGIKLLVIDYLQLMAAGAGAGRKFESRQQEITFISAGVKALAKDLDIPIIAISQLNREMERDKNRKPRLSDLRESGAIEQDADVVGLLYRPKSGDEEDDGASAMPVNLLIAKQRNGETGDVHLTFLKQFTRFESAAKIDPKDQPKDVKQPYKDE